MKVAKEKRKTRPCSCPKREVLEYLYLHKRLSIYDIAKIFRVSHEAVRYWLKQYRIPLRDRVYAIKTRKKKGKINLKEIKQELREKFGIEVKAKKANRR
jgi:transposase